MPDRKPLKDGDIVNIDVTLILDGWHGDSSRMYLVGDVPRRAQRLVEVTYESLMRGMAAVRPGATTAISAPPSKTMPNPNAVPSCATFAAMALAASFTTNPTFSIMAAAAKACCSNPACSSDRADDQSRPSACEDPVRRLDCGDRDRSLSAQFEHTIVLQKPAMKRSSVAERLHHPPYTVATPGSA